MKDSKDSATHRDEAVHTAVQCIPTKSTVTQHSLRPGDACS
jgi:hypothetical protein